MFNRSSRFSHKIPGVLIATLLAVGSVAVGAPTASAGPTPNLWDTSDRDCFSAFGKGVILLTSLAPNVEDENIWANPIKPTDGYVAVTGTPSVNVEFVVPGEFFAGERIEAAPDPIWGFYMMSVEFVESCENPQPAEFVPCFTTTVGPDPWVFDLGNLQLLFFIYGDVSADQSSEFAITENTGSCVDDEEGDGGPGNFGDLIDLIDEIGLEFPIDFTPDLNFDFSLEPYIKRAQAAELPNTL